MELYTSRKEFSNYKCFWARQELSQWTPKFTDRSYILIKTSLPAH